MHTPQQLVLVRHAESLSNAIRVGEVYLPNDERAALLRGVPDHKVPLTDQGWRQAEATGLFLHEAYPEFDVIYDSYYARTVGTRESILKAYPKEQLAKMEIRQHHMLRERERGYTHDMTTEEKDKYFPWLDDHFNSLGYFYFRPPGGQSLADMCDQLAIFLEREMPKLVGKKVLIVAHGRSILAIRYNLEGWSPDELAEKANTRPSIPNCGITTYHYSSNKQGLELISENVVCY